MERVDSALKRNHLSIFLILFFFSVCTLNQSEKLTNNILCMLFQVFLAWWLMSCTHRFSRSPSALAHQIGGPTTGTMAGLSGKTLQTSTSIQIILYAVLFIVLHR